jgi:hypothetical protein
MIDILIEKEIITQAELDAAIGEKKRVWASELKNSSKI